MTTRTKSTNVTTNASHSSPDIKLGAAATPPTPATPASPATLPIGFIAPPPPSASIPSVPDGFKPTNGTNYRGSQPRVSELVALPLAIRDLQNFASYNATIGATAPSLAEVKQTFEVTNLWSAMRNASSAWDQYARDQEGIAWTAMRSVIGRLKPAFGLAVKTNPSLATIYAGLAALLGAKTVIAHKAVATKKKNKLSVAEGKPATHGQVGKTRHKAAARAALAAQGASAGTHPIASTSAPAAATPAVSGPTAVAPAPHAADGGSAAAGG